MGSEPLRLPRTSRIYRAREEQSRAWIVEQGVAHPLRGDYIDVLDTIREGDLFAFPRMTMRLRG
jgi:hypothetical protein